MKKNRTPKLGWFQRFIRRLNNTPCTLHTLSTRQLRRLALVHHERQRRFLPRVQETRDREAQRYRESREALGLPAHQR